MINADTNEEIEVLQTGDILNDVNIIDVSAYENNAFNIVAKTSDQRINFVTFDFNDQQNYRFERSAPYALQGDINGDFLPLAFENGFNRVTAIPNGNRRLGNPLTVYFTVEGATETAAKGAVAQDAKGVFTMTPNPATAMVNVNIDSASSIVALSLFDSHGRKVYTNDKNISGTLQIDVSKFAQGLYILSAMDADGVRFSEKLFVN